MNGRDWDMAGRDSAEGVSTEVSGTLVVSSDMRREALVTTFEAGEVKAEADPTRRQRAAIFMVLLIGFKGLFQVYGFD
jgi:hypothetical protein